LIELNKGKPLKIRLLYFLILDLLEVSTLDEVADFCRIEVEFYDNGARSRRVEILG